MHSDDQSLDIPGLLKMKMLFSNESSNIYDIIYSIMTIAFISYISNIIWPNFHFRKWLVARDTTILGSHLFGCFKNIVMEIFESLVSILRSRPLSLYDYFGKQVYNYLVYSKLVSLNK